MSLHYIIDLVHASELQSPGQVGLLSLGYTCRIPRQRVCRL